MAFNSRERHRVFCASMADVFENRIELDAHRERLWDLVRLTPWLDWLLLTKRPENIGPMVPWEPAEWPMNVWIGTTVENQQLADVRLPHLLKHRAAIRFLSCEPLLGSIDLSRWMAEPGLNRINWIIAGGESGPGARPMHPEWVTGLLKQCKKSAISFHFKQWGHWVPAESAGAQNKTKLVEFPFERSVEMVRLPKREAGRVLAGKTWDGLPKVRAMSYP